MSFATKYNKNKVFDVDTTGFTYASIADLYNNNGADKIYTLRGVWINTKGKFGDQPLGATDKFYVNFPTHMLNTIKEILKDDESIKDINAGKCGFQIYSYTNAKFDRECLGIKFVDLN